MSSADIWGEGKVHAELSQPQRKWNFVFPTRAGASKAIVCYVGLPSPQLTAPAVAVERELWSPRVCKKLDELAC